MLVKIYKAFLQFLRGYFFILLLGVVLFGFNVKNNRAPWTREIVGSVENRNQENITNNVKKTVWLTNVLQVDSASNQNDVRMDHDATIRSVVASLKTLHNSQENGDRGESQEKGYRRGLERDDEIVLKEDIALEEEEEEDAMSYDIKKREKKFQALAKKYAVNDTLIVAVTDLGYVEMALNLYESSFKRFGIENYLFACSHELAEEYLVSRDIHAISLWNDSLSTKESMFNGMGYRNKTNFKTDSVLLTLRLGINVFLVDVDLVFLKNPLPYISQFSSTHDIIIQRGFTTLNSGCYMATNHGPAEELHSRMIEIRDKPRKGGGGNQKDMNQIMKGTMAGRIKIKVLDEDLFPWGGYYFYKGGREFAGDNATSAAYLVHNNVYRLSDFGSGVKRYRFREALMWHVDNGRYYSDPSRKYMTFEYPSNFNHHAEQKKVLRSAFELAHALNRTLILPAFNCHITVTMATEHCNYQRRFARSPFYLDVIEGQYREHMFLQHPKVPSAVKLSQSKKITLKPLNQKLSKSTFTEQDIPAVVEYLKDYEIFSVLNFEDLHLFTFHTNSSLREKLAKM